MEQFRKTCQGTRKSNRNQEERNKWNKEPFTRHEGLTARFNRNSMAKKRRKAWAHARVLIGWFGAGVTDKTQVVLMRAGQMIQRRENQQSKSAIKQERTNPKSKSLTQGPQAPSIYDNRTDWHFWSQWPLKGLYAASHFKTLFYSKHFI